MLSTRAVEAGEELTLSYGAHSNARLLRLYGFGLPANPHDTVPLYTAQSPVLASRTVEDGDGAAAAFSLAGDAAPQHAVQWASRAAALLPQFGELAASVGSLPPWLLGCRALLLDGLEGQRVQGVLEGAGMGVGVGGGDDEALLAWLGRFDALASSGQMPAEALRVVVAALLSDCHAALARYPTTLEQDDAALDGAAQMDAAGLAMPGRQPGGGLGGLRLLVGEKAILARTAAQLQGLGASLG